MTRRPFRRWWARKATRLPDTAGCMHLCPVGQCTIPLLLMLLLLLTVVVMVVVVVMKMVVI